MTFTPEILAQSAGAVSRERKLLGEVIHPAAPADAERGAAKGHRRHEDRADKRVCGRGGVDMGPEVDETVFIVGFLVLAVILICKGWMEKMRRR